MIVTGACGLLGAALCQRLQERYQVHALVRSTVGPIPPGLAGLHAADLRQPQAVQAVVRTVAPVAVFHAAAFTGVDRAQTEREAAWATNVLGTAYVARACREVGAALIHLSTDYVFDGKNGPYREGHRPNPISHYGLSKFWSERMAGQAGARHLIARTTVLYGPGAKLDFVSWVRSELAAGRRIQVVNDQYGSPTLSTDLADTLVRLWERGAMGLYHVAGPDWLNRFEFARRIAAHFGLDAGLIGPLTTAALRQPARRPLLGGLVCTRAETLLGRSLLGAEAGLRALSP